MTIKNALSIRMGMSSDNIADLLNIDTLSIIITVHFKKR